MPIYERLCALAGGSDLSARFLSLYRPPPYISGCSQAVWRGDEPVLIRNYDYDPRLCDGLILDTAWSGGRVIAAIDCLWGCLDGMNEAGLALSLSFGGRRAVGDGFGIPIVLRYVLEFCRTAAEAAEVLRRVPTHMAYNVTAIDRTRRVLHRPAGAGPAGADRPGAARDQPPGRHRMAAPRGRHRERRARAVPRAPPVEARDRARRSWPMPSSGRRFIRRPIARGYGTLYTAIYRPARGEVEYRWPELSWTFSFAAFGEGVRRIHLLSETA